MVVVYETNESYIALICIAVRFGENILRRIWPNLLIRNLRFKDSHGDVGPSPEKTYESHVEIDERSNEKGRIHERGWYVCIKGPSGAASPGTRSPASGVEQKAANFRNVN